MTTQVQIKEKNKLEKYKKSRKTYKSETGITIITLVITIIVLLILSGITITALSGDNGILKRAAEAKQETEKNQVIEMVQLEVLGTYAEADGEFDSEKFKDNVKDHLKNYNPVISEDEKTITVEVKKYEVVVDKETGEVVKKGEVKGVTPIFETKLYNEDGTELKGEGKGTVIVGVKLTNKEKLDKYSIEIKNSKGEKIEADTTTIGEGEVSFTIKENGKYTIIVKGTKEGTERTNQKTLEIGVGEEIITNIEINPNGGAKYIVPTEGKAKIKVGIEEKAGENKYKYSYGWSTDETEKPTTWTETASKAEIEKTDCEEGKYYLWIKVVSEKGNEKYIESNKFEVISNRKITIEANTKEITNKDVKLKISYDELLTENRNIEVTGKRGTDYEINGENEVIIKTNNQTVTVSATDIAGNKITEKTIISNIDKAQPVVTFGTNGSTSYKKSQSTTVTVKSIGVSTIVANSLKYQWTQSTTAPAENTFSTTFTSGETITKTDGTGNNWYLWIIAKNTAGTTIITKSNAFYLDNTAPNTTAPTATGTTNTVVVTFAQTDAHSGIDASTRQYSIKKTSDSIWGSWVTDSNNTHTFTNLTLNTEYQVRTQVKDVLGNGYAVSATKTITTVNITKPTITLSTTSPTNKSITATITYPEITGITKQYSYDNKTWTKYTTALTIDTNKTIYARSIDSTNQGSDSTRVASLTVTNIDKTQPTVTFGTNGSTSYKKSQSTTVTVTNAGTSTINASSLKYQWTQSTTAPAESSFTATFSSGGTITKSDGTGNNWYLWILAKDKAGNTTIVKSNAFYLDNTAPNTTAPTATSTTNSIVVTSAQTDSNSGINASTRQYSIKKTSDSSWGEWITDSNGTHTFTNLTLNTEYQVRTQVKDVLGNGYAISGIKTITTVNITKPTITLSTTSPTNKSITATITYPEITGLTKQYSYDNKTWTTYTTLLTIDTNKTIYARSIDSTNQGSDSTRVASLTVTNIDKTQPTVTFGTNGSTSYKKSQSTTVTVNDASGINTLKYQWLQSATAPAESSFTATFTSGGTITKSDGTGNNWYLWILAKDKAGNTTIVKSNAFYLDNTAPNTTAPTATSTTNSIVVTSAQTDSNSGIEASTRQYSIKKTSDSSWGAWITDKNNTHTFTNLTLNTEYQVRTQIKDVLGNGYAISGTKAITTVNITKPTITPSTTAPTNKSITATITYPEITGITKQYSFDNNIWITYTGPVTIENNRTIYARSIDSTNQGSDSTRVASLSVTNIDKAGPTVTFGTNGSTSYKKSQSTTVTVTNAGTSAVNASSLKYQWTQSTTAPAENTFSTTFTSGGTITKSDGTGNNWYLWILAKNTAGNTTIVKSNVFYLDNTAPNTTAPTATSTTNSIVVTSAQTDANSGINASTRQYSIKKKSDSSWGSWVTDSNGTHTFTNLTLNTEYQVRTQVKDALGNGYAISAIKTITTVNITKPTITLSTTAPTNQNITATITYPNITGITKQYSYDNKTWTKYTTALTIDTNKTIYARSIDSTNQGSDSTRVASLSVTNIDKTPPTVTHTIKNKKAKSVDIVITATDKNGIKSIANVTTTGITKTDTNTYTVTKNQDYEFKVTDNAGNVTNYTVTVTGITKVTLDAETIAKNPEAYYGKKVNNYTAGGKTYRIFYIDTEGKFGDKNTVYLKADWTANDTTLSSYTSYTPSGTDLATYKKLNPSWAAQRGSSTSSWNDNEHAAAWLCSPSNWTTYCDTSKANYAIGSPTAEMYVASYNQVSHTTGNYKLGATYRATSYPGYMYTVNGTLQNGGCLTDNNTLDYTRYNSMYCGKNGSKEGYWWLASPSSEYYNAICVVDGEHANLTNGPRSGTYGVCPLVSLKSDFEIEITLPSTIDAETIAENPGAYYGQKVTNYTAGGKTYRIFYVDTEGKFGDKNTIYLKADWTSNDTSLSDYPSYTPSGTDLEIYKKLNPSWAAARGSSTSSWYSNEYAAAWLCSPSKWTTYCDTSKANYAIGAPTAEMYVASYNQVSHTTGNYNLGATYRATSYPGYIYTVNGTQQNSGYGTNNNTLDYTGYNSMYCGKNGSTGSYYWWLASPSACDYAYVCYVNGSGAYLDYYNYGNSYGVSPLVSLKPGIGVELENEIEITDAETIAENPQNYYGKKISNYTAGGQTYRIFYVDKQNDFGDGANTVYLKADYNDNLQKSLNTNISSLTANDLAVYKRMNKSWAAQRGNSQSNWNSNENAAAYLSAPSQWTTYCDTTKANYAIGSPPVEMYVASYNQVSHTTGNYKLGVTYRETSYPGYICTVNGTQQNSGYYTDQYILDYIGYNSMYCGKNGSTGRYYWWLASPSAFNFDYVYLVYGNLAYFGGNDFGALNGVCPLVSLKSGIKLIITSE